MLFNSVEFGLFLPLVFILYWFVFNRSVTAQNVFTLAASYFFYCWWDWRFLFLLLGSTVLDYSFGLLIYNSPKGRKKLFLWLGMVNNLGVLFFFKYCNFFIESATQFLSLFGVSADPLFLSVILPIGISFYTFHGMSYVIDIYRGNFKPVRNFADYALFVSFFPLLIAGPIERATHLLPQLIVKRVFNYRQAVEGVRLMVWGLFKKIVVADNCAVFVNQLFSDYQHASGLELALGTILFAFQIYGDFSGYSDIAIGTAKLLGIELFVNFRTPYFARDIAEFWRRWHISLTTWFRDYLYIPLGGSKGSKWQAVRNTLFIFLISGFWHGARWTFVVWGALNALYFLPLLLSGSNRNHTDIVASGKLLPSAKEFFQMGLTFGLVCFAWIFFRSQDLNQALEFITMMIRNKFLGHSHPFPVETLTIVVVFLGMEWMTRETGMEKFIHRFGFFWRNATYVFLIIMILSFGRFNNTEFIYFQF